jgi:capsular exopolysaccharide synthesis family protein
LAELHTLVVTSAVKSEGKTSVSVQLAASLARASGERCLLVDADLRSPDIHRLLKSRAEPGLAEVLAGECSLGDAIDKTWNERIHLLPAGKATTSPHKLLGGDQLDGVLAELRTAYQYVVLDTPPVLAASEALMLARAADGTLICAMRDVSRVSQVSKTFNWLVAAGARPVGAVLSGVPTRHYAYHYGYGSGSYAHR